MSGPKAVAWTVGLMALGLVTGLIVAGGTYVLVLRRTGDPAAARDWANACGGIPTSVVVTGSALWAAVDARRIELRKRGAGLPSKPVLRPVATFIIMSGFWLIVFPLYLHSRGSGATPTPGPQEVAAVDRWECRGCGEPVEGQFEACWKCGAARSAGG